MAVNSSGSTDSDPEAPPQRRRPPVKKKSIVGSNTDRSSTERVEESRPERVVEEAPSRPVRRKVRREEPVIESEPEGFGFDPEEFLPPAIEVSTSRPARSREPRSTGRPVRRPAIVNQEDQLQVDQPEVESRQEAPRQAPPRRESPRREPARREPARREPVRREPVQPEPSTRLPEGDDVFNNDGDRGYSDRYYAARPADEVESPRRGETSRGDSGRGESDTESMDTGDHYPQNRGSQGQDLENSGPPTEGGEGEGSEFQRRRRRRRRPRTNGGRPEGQANSPPPSQLGAARFNNATGRNSNRGGSNTSGGGRPQRGPGRSQGGGSRDRVNSGTRDSGSSQGGSRDGGRSGGYRDRAPREYTQDRANFNEQAMADIPGTAVSGVLELHPKGYGFLRDPANNYSSAKTDPFVSGTLIERSGLREGVLIKGEAIPGPKGQGPRLKSVESVEGRTIEEYQKIKNFDTLTAINPHDQIVLETGPMPITMRVIDLLCPIGKGQRALIVAPPRTGKTMLLQDIANAVSKNHPEMYLIVLLIDERPEEVTEMRRNVRGEVIASSMDRDVESHVRISQLIIERGKRIAEAGGEVFILLDSITRTARAFNKWVGSTGRTTTGGLDVKALDIPKKMFGTARLFDEGGSLTIAATALIETGSRMDDVIFQEFKGTGNMEMVLSRNLADRRIWPSIDIQQSGTRREEKILSPETLEGVTMLRRSLLSMNPVEGMEQLTRILQKYPSNKEFLSKIRSIL